MSDVLIECENVGKKFCRDLKKSLWYGITDSVSDITLRRPSGYSEILRSEEFWANSGISFRLKRGECLGLLGKNGAGKTTLLKMLNGLVKPDTGHIKLRGTIGALIALGAGFNPVLSGRENIYVNASVLGFKRREIKKRLGNIVDFAGIENAIDSPVRTYSSGMTARLGFSVAAFLDTDILLIDEVLAVGDISFRMRCYQLLREKFKNGASAILVSHNEIDLARVCTRALLLKVGRPSFVGDLDSTLNAYQESLFEEPKGNAGDFNVLSFLNVHAENSDGDRCVEFGTHDDVTIVARIHASKQIKNARILFHVDDARLGRICSASTSCSGKQLLIKEGFTTIRVTLPRLPLLFGSYRVLLDVYGPNVEDFYGMSSPVNLQVTSPRTDAFGFGMFHTVHLEHHWNILPE